MNPNIKKTKENKLPIIEAQTNHKAGRFVCNSCDKRFRKPCLLRRHEVMHLTVKPFKCSDCNKQFSQNASLQRHYKEQHDTDKKRFQCTKCALSQKSNLQLHDKKVHLPLSEGKAVNVEGYACEQCPSVYCNKQKLSRHINAVHKNINNDKLNPVEAEMEDELGFTKNVLEQLKTLQIEMEAYDMPIANAVEIIANPNQLPDIAVESLPQQQEQRKGEHLINEVTLKNHKNAQISKVRALYTCEFCSKEFRKSYNFLRHRRVHTRQRPYKCAFCESGFSTKTKLHEHETIHRLNEHFGIIAKTYPCAVCCQVFSSLRQLDKHTRIHANTFTLKYECKICGATFKTSTALSSHKHEEVDEDLNYLKQLLPIPVDVPTTNTIETKAVDFELKAHKSNEVEGEQSLNEKPKWMCFLCDRIFSNSSVLRKHQRIYHSSKSQVSTSSTIHCFKCAYCMRYFKNQTLCKAHMLKHLQCLLNTDVTNPQGNQDSNIINGKVIVIERATNIIAIVKAFNVSTTYRKQVCRESLANSKYMRSKCKDQLQHKCHFCSRLFKKSCDLKRHLLIHTGERLHACSICDKSFSLKRTLREHQLTHAFERAKCVCIVCGKMYASKKSLNVHLRLHTCNQPFSCEHCVRKFRTSGQKIAHMRAVHDEIRNTITNNI
ncbi:zinc finger protein 91-like isoform X2 [Eurosta solidaginis]|uniref:zinc finger protein 91-like isoform X2 n=1 Tax=Eurosta solidaginis TaxID=178769 RepID=UPI003530BF3A